MEMVRIEKKRKKGKGFVDLALIKTMLHPFDKAFCILTRLLPLANCQISCSVRPL